MQIKDDNKYMKPYDKDKASNCVLCQHALIEYHIDIY